MKSLEQNLVLATRVGLYALLVTPLFFFHGLTHPHSSTQSYAILALSEVTFLCFVWLAWMFPKWRPTWTLVDKVFFVFVGILFLTLLLGEDPFFSFWSSMDRTTGGLMWAHLTAVYMVVRSLLRRRDEWVMFFSVSLVVALISAFLHLLFLVGIDLIVSSAGGSTFGNSTYFAVYLLLNCSFALFVLTQAKTRFLRLFAGASSVVLAATLLTTAANMARISLVGGLLLGGALWALSFGKKKLTRFVGWGVMVMLVASSIVGGVLAFQPGSVVQDTLIDLSSGARFVLWDIAWQGIQEKPLLGWGLENYALVSYAFFDPCLGTEACGGEIWFDRAHNKFLDVWVESGIIGVIAYLSIFVTALVCLWRVRRTSAHALRASIVLTSILAAYFVHNLTALEPSTILLFWVFLLAAVSAASEPSVFFGENHPSNSSGTRSIGVPIAASLFFPFAFFFFVIQPVQANVAVRQAIFATQQDQRKEAYDIATTVSPLGIDMRRVWLADDTVKLIWQEIPTGSEIPTGLQSELVDAQMRLEDTLRRSPGNVRARIALGFVYQTQAHFLGDSAYYEKAISIFEEGLRQSPTHPFVRRALAGVYLDQGDTQRGIDLTQSLIELSTESASAYGYHLIALRLAGDQDLFERVASQALAQFPSLAGDIEQIRGADSQADRQALLALFH